VRCASGRSPLTDAKAGLLFYTGPWTPWETGTPHHGARDRHQHHHSRTMPRFGLRRGHDAAMVDAQLAPRVVPTPVSGRGKVVPRPIGGGVRHRRVTCAPPQLTHDPAGAKLVGSTAPRQFFADAADRTKGLIAALLVRSVTAPCRGVSGRQTVVGGAIGIAPSRSLAPELTSESDQRVGAWPGQSARLSSTHSPRRARDPERLRSRPHGSGS